MLTNMLPGAKRSGGEIVTQSVVDALFSAGREVSVLGYRRPADTTPDARGELCVGRRPIETRDAGLRVAEWMLRAIATRAPYSTTKWHSRGYLRAIDAALARRPELVIVDHAGIGVVAPPPERLGAPLVFLAHNAEAEMYERVSAASGRRAGRWVYAREARLIRRVEAGLARRAAQTWALTEHDAGYFRSLGSRDVRTLEVASAIDEPEAPGEPEYDVAVIGTWSWHANAHGLEWFAREVVPRLPADLTVHVAGRGADWLDGRFPNVTVRGVVPDAGEFMARARVVGAPSVEGGGIQLKTLDGIACGVPVVATGVAARGIDDLPGSVAVADDPAEFAAELVRLARDPDRAGLREEALEWSRARRRRLEADVAGWVSELAGPAPEPAAAEPGRSAARTA